MTKKRGKVTIELDPSDPIVQALKFENELGLRKGYLQDLLDDDDWSFVIKLHALVEAAITHLLVAEVGRPELEPVFARIDIAGAATGKLAFVKAMNCLGEENRRYIRALAELRNRLVHDVRHVGTSLDQYVGGLDKNQLKEFIKAIGPGRDPIELGAKSISEVEFVRDNPKLVLWMTGVYVLAYAYLRIEEVAVSTELREMRARMGETLLTAGKWRLPVPDPRTAPPE